MKAVGDRADKSDGKVSRGGRTAVRLVDSDTRQKATGKAAAPKSTARPRRGEEVRERILRAGLECFAAFGFEGASTRAVAERAGVTHTLVLYHFQSKEQLWISTMETALGQYGEGVKSNLEQSGEGSAKEALGTFIEQFVRMSARLPQIHRIFTAEANQETGRLVWIVDHFNRWHFTTIRDLIRRGQAEGTVRECDPARLYYLIIGAGGTPFTLATEYRMLTGRDVFAETEVLRNIAFIYEIVFV